jgi:uracil-DNA glycosylase family 4
MMLPPKSKTFVPPSGRLDAPYVLIGEQPGRVEVRERRVFVGPAGNELNSDLNAADVARPLCYLTNVIKDLDRHKDAYIQLYKGNRLLSEPIVSPQGQAYLDFLQWELSQTTSKYFGAIGAIALYALTGRLGITKWRGSLLDCTLAEGRKVIPMLHPATVIAPKFQYFNKRLIIFDLKRLRSYQSGLMVPTEREVTTGPTFIQVMDFLNYCQQKGLEGNRISYDIEVFMNRVHKQISCIAFATNRHAMCIPFADSNGDYFVTWQEIEIWRKIAEVLEDPKIRICGQNLVFDGHFLLRLYGIRVTNLDDTMIAQNTIMPDYPKGLDFITSLWTDHPYYKADGKAFFKGSGKYQKFWVYNATDANICDEAIPKQMIEVDRLDNMAIYKEQVRLIEPLVYMMERGLKVDVKKMEATNRDYESKIIDFQEQLNEVVGRSLNANSFDQLGKYFHDEKKIKQFKKKGKVTYGDDAMKRMIRKGVKEAKLIQQIRRYTKLRSTYLNLGKIDDDGRIRCSYNPVGTKFSRLSSSKNIWGTGGNQQNIPHHLQEFLVPDPGYVYYAFDLEQAENRIVAYVGEIINMIDCFESGQDVHSKTARMIMMVYYQIKELNNHDVLDLAPLGDGTHDWRFYGKKSNHGLNYDLGYKNFSLENEITETDGKMIYLAYHHLYPGVQQSYHSYVRQQLRNGRTLTNLMGRKTLFLGPLSGPKADKTFKEAYSCIPQGTVGDIINKWGVNYIYYNQDLFKPVELLRQVHDEIGFQIPLKIPWSEHTKMLRMIKKSLEQPLTTHNGRTFVIPAELTMGITMNKEAGKDISFEEDLANNLKQGWKELNNGR